MDLRFCFTDCEWLNHKTQKVDGHGAFPFLFVLGRGRDLKVISKFNAILFQDNRPAEEED